MFTCQESCCLNNDYDTIKQERDAYQTQLATKDQKIAELEQIIQELRNKPPLSPVNNQTEEKPTQPEPNNFLIETQSVVGDQKEELLNTIQQQKETIQELQSKLKNAGKAEVIVEEVSKTKIVKDNEFCYQCLFNWIVIILLGLNTVRLLKVKSKKK